MNFFIKSGKIGTLFGWVLMLYNYFIPLSAPFNTVFDVLLLITVSGHFILLIISYKIFGKQTDTIKTLLFGIFHLYPRLISKAGNRSDTSK